MNLNNDVEYEVTRDIAGWTRPCSRGAGCFAIYPVLKDDDPSNVLSGFNKIN